MSSQRVVLRHPAARCYEGFSFSTRARAVAQEIGTSAAGICQLVATPAELMDVSSLVAATWTLHITKPILASSSRHTVIIAA